MHPIASHRALRLSRPLPRSLSLAIAGLLALACAGCSAPLTLQRLAPGETPPPGLVFPLAFTRFEVTVTRTLAGCDEQGALIETRVEAGAGHAAPDPAHTYLVQPGPGGPFFAGQARVAYAATGAAKGFNASVDDRSAATASSVASVMRRFGWLGLLAGAARPPACGGGSGDAGAGTRAAAHAVALKQVDRFLWPPDGSTFQSRRMPPGPPPWPAAQPVPALELRLVDEAGRHWQPRPKRRRPRRWACPTACRHRPGCRCARVAAATGPRCWTCR